MDLGADDVLTKPVSVVVIAARLRSLVRRSRQRPAAPVTVGDLELDPTTRQVTSHGTLIPLTRREFALLEFLLRHPGDAKSKTEILGHVWPPEHRGNVNLVEVYVGHLRRKLDEPWGTNVIETVRGIGYRVSPSQLPR